MDNPLRQDLWRAGHARPVPRRPPVALRYVDEAATERTATVRWASPAAADAWRSSFPYWIPAPRDPML
jgi:hypothetical protein